MRKSFFILFSVLILLFGLNLQISAVSAYRYFTVENGLPSNRVYCIITDSRGFVWFGTENGLVRYDGHDMKIFQNIPNDPESLPINYVYDVVELPDGRLWIAMWGGGTALFDPASETFQSFTHDESDVDSIGSNTIGEQIIAEDGSVWMYALAAGLNRFDPENGKFQRFLHDANDIKSIPSNLISKIYGSSDGRYIYAGMWNGDIEKGFFKFDTKKGEVVRLNNIPNSASPDTAGTLWSFIEDDRNILWIGSSQGISRYNLESETFIDDGKYHELDGIAVYSMTRTVDGRIWIGTVREGIYIADQKTKTITHLDRFLPVSHAMPNSKIYDIYESPQGHIWLATSDGIEQYVPDANRFEFIADDSYKNKIKSIGISRFLEDRQRRLWIAGNNNGIQIYDSRMNQLQHLTQDSGDKLSISDRQVRDMIEDESGNIWIGTLNGLNMYSAAGNSIIQYFSDKEKSEGLTDNKINSLTIGTDNTLWIGYGGHGLQHFNPDTGSTHLRQLETKKSHTMLPNSWIRTLYTDKQGNIWAGEEKGLYMIDPDTYQITSYAHDPEKSDSISSGVIRSIFQDKENRMWFGTDTGLNLLIDNHKFRKLTKEDGLPGNVIMSIIEDRKGYLWLGTNNGLARFEPESGEVISFTIDDGLQGKLFNPEASLLSAKGILYFGGINGYNKVDPDTIKISTISPRVILTDFKLYNKSVKPGAGGLLQKPIYMTDKIILDSSHRVFGFHFAALNFFAPEKVGYVYRLTGVDKDWVKVDSGQRWTNYSHLESGIYSFQVRATNTDGIMSSNEVSLKLIMLPDWWETTWFRISLALSLLLLLIAFYYIRLSLYRNKQAELERIVSSQTKELRDARDKAEYEARTDSLTGLTNRRSFTEYGEHFIARAKRFEHKFCLAVLDIDFFKKVNDTHGHKSGDDVLKELAQVINQNIRNVDISARIGGEEFAIIYDGTGIDRCLETAERLRNAIEVREFISKDIPLKITISIGIAEWSTGDSLDDLLIKSDKALYQAKENGRNQIVQATH